MDLETDDFEPDQYFLLMDDGQVRTRTVRIWPHTAEAWLTRNAVNRPVSARNVQRLVWDISNGDWVLTHQGLAFNRKGELIDGQHRLHAIRRAGKPVLARVTFNLDASFAAPIDTCQVRRPSDILPISQRDVAVANALLLLETRSMQRGTTAKIAQTYEQHQVGIDWARKALPMQRGITASLVAGFVFAYPVARREVEAFADAFVQFTGADATDPVVVLRRHIEHPRFAPTARLELSLAALKCLHAHCERHRLSRLYITEHGFAYFGALRARQGL